MASLLTIQCSGCKEVCNCLQIPSDTMKNVLKSEDKKTAEYARKVFKMKVVMVFCQVEQEIKVIHLGGT